MRRYGFARACRFIVLLGTVSPALAQETAPSSGEPEPLSEVTVTSTRVSRPGYDAPTPTTVVDSQMLESRASSILIDALAQLPASRNTGTSSSANQNIASNGGQSFINLRGLGPNRTLVLFNGQRIVPTAGTGAVDIALLPEALVKQVDVVTGGASAAYGSDAIAGVVNLILDNELEGLRVRGQAGASTRNDNETEKASVAWGGRFADQRLHTVVGAEYLHSDGVDAFARDFSRNPSFAVANGAYTPTNGQTQQLLTPYVYTGNSTFNGVIVGGPLNGTEFLPGGATRPFAFCDFNNNSTQVCDGPRSNLANLNYFTKLASPEDRHNVYGGLSFELTPNLELFADALYGYNKTRYETIPYVTSFHGLLTVQSDNAFLPGTVRDQLTTNGLSSFSLGRYSRDFGSAKLSREANIRRISTALRASFNEHWKLDAYGVYNESENHFAIANVPIRQKLNNAIDSVLVNGVPTCRVNAVTVTDPSCVPVNLFGDGSASPEAVSYFAGTTQQDLELKETAIGVNLAGEPFSSWAGPVSVAIGGEYRRDKADQTVDPTSQARGYIFGNFQPLAGTINVREAYGEMVFPLAKDAPFAKNLELNTAVRNTHYNLSGSVTTWKLGTNYSPFKGLRFRGTGSRDIRAPNLIELRSGISQSNQQIFDPVTNTTATIPAFISGNSDLQPERADTIAAGVILDPVFLPGFTASIDYYRIDVQNAISTLSAPQIVSLCARGDTDLCRFVNRNADGILTSVSQIFLNVAQIKTDGIDFELTYRLPVGPGAMELRALANNTRSFLIDNGFTTIQQAGTLSAGAQAGSIGDGEPHWTGDLSAQYSTGRTTVLAYANYFGGGYYSAIFRDNISPSRVGSVTYFNATLERKLDLADTDVTLFLNGSNLFDRHPPKGFEFQGNNYDRIGRAIKVGFRMMK